VRCRDVPKERNVLQGIGRSTHSSSMQTRRLSRSGTNANRFPMIFW
jgi:hypothetical protein